MVKHKYESKWKKGFYYPLLSSDHLETLKELKYNIIKITNDEFQKLIQEKTEQHQSILD